VRKRPCSTVDPVAELGFEIFSTVEEKNSTQSPNGEKACRELRYSTEEIYA